MHIYIKFTFKHLQCFLSCLLCSLLQFSSVWRCVAVCCSGCKRRRRSHELCHIARVAVCCSALQYVTVAMLCSIFTACSSMLQCVATCCSLLQYVCSVTLRRVMHDSALQYVSVRWSTLQQAKMCCRITCNKSRVRCRILQYVAVYFNVLQRHLRRVMRVYVAVCRSVLQCVAVCCVLQYVCSVTCDASCVTVCYSVLQCVAVCCSVLQCVAVCCSVLKYVAVRCIVLQCHLQRIMHDCVLQYVAVCCSMLQYVVLYCSVACDTSCVTVCRSVLHYVAVRCSMMQYVSLCCSVTCNASCMTVCCSVMQYVAVCCSMLYYIAVSPATSHAWLYVAVHCCSVLQYVAICLHFTCDASCVTVCCSVMQYVAVCCSALHCVACHLRRIMRKCLARAYKRCFESGAALAAAVLLREESIYTESHNMYRERYSPFCRRWDSKCSSECETKSWMVLTGLLSNGSFEKRHELWPSRISLSIPTSISSLIFYRMGNTVIDMVTFGWWGGGI